MQDNHNTNINQRRWGTRIIAFMVGVFIASIPNIINYIVAQPKISGRIVVATHGNLNDVRISAFPLKTITVYAYIANARDVPVSIVDYTLDVNIKGKWERVKLLYNKFTNLRLGFGSPSPFGKNVSLLVPSDNIFLVSKLGKVLRREDPLGGILLFVSELDISNIEGMRLNIYDGFGGIHVITKSIIHDPHVLLRLAPELIVENK